eukprot:6474021-Amphidinium_carterae.2
MFTEVGTEAFEEIRWMTERRFKSWMRNTEELTAAEAAAAWERALACKDTERRMKDGQWQVSVLTKEGKRKFWRRGTKRAHESRQEVSDGENSDELAKRKRHVRAHLEDANEAHVDSAFSGCVAPALPQSKANSAAQSVQAILGKMSSGADDGHGCGGTASSGGMAMEHENPFQALQLTEVALKSMGLTKARGKQLLKTSRERSRHIPDTFPTHFQDF